MTRLAWFDRKAIGRRLQEARGERSQREVGERLGYRQPHISRYERGNVPGSFRFLAGLAEVFGVDVNWILTGRGCPDVAALPLEDAGATGSEVGPAAADRAGRGRAAGNGADEALMDALEQFVLRVVGGAAGARADRRAGQQAMRLRLPALALSAWDGLQVELPFLLAPLIWNGSPAAGKRLVPLERLEPEDTGSRIAGSERGVSREATQPLDVAALTDSLARAVANGDAGAALAELTRAARELEERDPSPVAFERARFLLLWAWLVAEAQAAQARAVAPSVPGVLFRLARVTRKAGRLDEAERLYLEARSRAAAAGEAEVVARSHAGLGNLYLERGEFEQARREYVALLEEALRLGNPRLLFRAYLNLSAYCHEHERAYGKAAEFARAGLGIARQEADREHAGRFLNELGLNEMELGKTAAAEKCFGEALAIAAELGSPLLQASARINLGELRLRSGAHENAVRLLREGWAAAGRAGLVWAQCQAEILLARAEHALGRTAAALERLERVEERCAARGLAHERSLARAAEREIQRGMLGRIEAFGA